MKKLQIIRKTNQNFDGAVDYFYLLNTEAETTTTLGAVPEADGISEAVFKQITATNEITAIVYVNAIPAYDNGKLPQWLMNHIQDGKTSLTIKIKNQI